MCADTPQDVKDRREKMTARFANVRTGGKGSQRRKKLGKRHSNGVDERRLLPMLKRFGVTDVSDVESVEEVMMFKDDGGVIRLTVPNMQASISANLFVVSGHAECERLDDELPPGPGAHCAPTCGEGLSMEAGVSPTKIRVSSEESIPPGARGVYSKLQLGSVVSQGSRPVYRNAAGLYLYYWEASREWQVGESYDAPGAYVRSKNGECAFSPELVAPGSWLYWTGSAWAKSLSVAVDAAHEMKGQSCRARLPVVGDQVLREVDCKSKDESGGDWILDAYETATVVRVDKDGDVKLRNPLGIVTKSFLYRKFFCYLRSFPSHVEISGSEFMGIRAVGVYSRTSLIPGVNQDNRSIYRNANGVYIYYWRETRAWHIGNSYSSGDSELMSKRGERALSPDLVTPGSWTYWSADAVIGDDSDDSDDGSDGDDGDGMQAGNIQVKSIQELFVSEAEGVTEATGEVYVISMSGETRSLGEVSLSDPLEVLYGATAKVFNIPRFGLHLIHGTHFLATKHVRSPLRSLGIRGGSELTCVRQRFVNVRAGMQIHVSDSGSDRVNGLYTCCSKKTTSHARWTGPDTADLLFEKDDESHYLMWWSATVEWPAGWYFEDPEYMAIYFHRVDDPKLMPCNFWEPYEALDYSLPGALPGPFLVECSDAGAPPTPASD